MKTLSRSAGCLRVAALLSAFILQGAPSRVRAAEPAEGVALAIVYDTSGSMQQSVRDSNGQLTPKNVIARRAIKAVLERLSAVAAGSGSGHMPVQAALVVFKGNTAEVAVKMAPFKAEPFRAWLDAHDQPRAGTPLGEAVRAAGEAVLASPLPRKHILVITDGVNTRGPAPTITLPQVLKDAKRQEAVVASHFVAFDVNAAAFDGVKKLGATVVGAADEKQLSSQLEFILEKKILLEDEEPPTNKPKTN